MSSGLIVGHVQHADVDAVGGELLGRVQRAHGHEAGRDDEHVAALADHLRLAELELVVRLVAGQHRGHLAAQQPHVDRPVMSGDLRHHAC